VTGSLAYDQIMDFPGKFSDHILPDKLHVLNVSFLVNNFRKGFGGTAGNIAYSLSLLGIKSSVLALVGSDFGSYKEFLDKNEVNTRYIKILNNFNTSIAVGITDSKDNQIWGFYTGADSLSDQLSLNNVSGKIDFGIVAPHNPRAMLKFAQEYKAKKIAYLFDPGMQLPWLKGDELKSAFGGAKIIIGNDYEVSIMEKKTKIRDLHSHFKDKIVITTLGEKGSILSHKGKKFVVSASAVKNASDPAGAGDAYRAGLVAGYLRGFDLETCGKMGSLAAGYTVEKYGTTTHFYTVNQFVKRYRINYNQELKL